LAFFRYSSFPYVPTILIRAVSWIIQCLSLLIYPASPCLFLFSFFFFFCSGTIHFSYGLPFNNLRVLISSEAPVQASAPSLRWVALKFYRTLTKCMRKKKYEFCVWNWGQVSRVVPTEWMYKNPVPSWAYTSLYKTNTNHMIPKAKFIMQTGQLVLGVPVRSISQTRLRGYLPKNGTIHSSGHAAILVPHHSV
jgi:hypothetical protein